MTKALVKEKLGQEIYNKAIQKHSVILQGFTAALDNGETSVVCASIDV